MALHPTNRAVPDVPTRTAAQGVAFVHTPLGMRLSPKDFQIGDIVPASVYVAAKYPGDKNGNQNVTKRFEIVTILQQSGTRCMFEVKDLATGKLERRGWSVLSVYKVERREGVRV